MPTLKLKTGGASSPDASADPQPTPVSATEPKSGLLKLKFSQPPTPATEQPGPLATSSNVGAKPPKAGGGAKKPRGGGGAGGGGRKRAANDDISPAPKRPQAGAPGRKISLKPAAAPQAGMEHLPASTSGLNRIMLKRRSTVPKLKQVSENENGCVISRAC